MSENARRACAAALVTIETIASVIEAYGRGEIELERAGERGPGQYKTIPGGKVYSLLSVARFLGWTKADGTQATSACREAFDAYQERAATHDALQSLTSGERADSETN